MEFNVNDTVLLPKYIIEKFIDSYWIVVAPDYPNWIILNDIEHTMFKYIKSRFKALSPSDGLSSTISGLKQINRIIKRIIKNG